jgi:hypothetical protein
MSHYCSKCDKNFKSYNSLYSHNKRFHSKNSIFLCHICSKTFDRKFNMDRHVKTCEIKAYKKKTKELIDEQKNKKQKIINYIRSMSYDDIDDIYNLMEIDDDIDDIPQSNEQSQPINAEITDSNLNSNNINNSNNNNVNNVNNANNANNNNTNIQNNLNAPINITVNLGKEELSKIISKSTQRKILNKRWEAPLYLIKHVHFNKKYPQFQNVLVTDLKSNKAFTYDSNKNGFKAVRKNELYKTMLESRINDLGKFYDENEEDLQNVTKNSVNDMLDKYNDELTNNGSEYIKNKYKDIDVMCYNEKDIFNQVQQ